MKLLVKPLKGGEFELDDVKLENTVLEVKEMIEKIKGEKEFPVGSQKLIHGGKIMKDDQTLQDYKVKEEGGFIVCMVSKKRPQKPKPKPAEETQTTQTGTTNPTTTGGGAGATTTGAGAGAVTGGGAVAQGTGPQGTGAAFEIDENQVQELASMGYDNDTVRAALTTARGNVELATEFLLDPALLIRAQQIQNLPPFERFRRHPQFEYFKAMVQQNPAALQQIIQYFNEHDPEIYAAIQGDRQGFVNMMSEPIDQARLQAIAQAQGMGGAGGGGGGGMAGAGGGGAPTGEAMRNLLTLMENLSPEQRQAFAGELGMNEGELRQVAEVMRQLPEEVLQRIMAQAAQGGAPGAGGLGALQQAAQAGAGGGGGGAAPGTFAQVYNQLTNEEKQAVESLQGLGFPREAALQAYMACGKDENAAANLLLNGNFNDDDNNTNTN